MRLPETENIHHQYAFKKGYRMAVDGKNPAHIPSDIRQDMEMREYFQQGWQQAVEDVTEFQKQQNKPDWKHRFVWFAVMAIGGLATAAHLINSIEKEKAEQQAIIDGVNPNTSSQPNSQPLTTTQEETELSLLSQQQRSDLIETQSEQKIAQNNLPLVLEPIVKSPITITESAITDSVTDRQPQEVYGNNIPKYIREVYFFTEISHANNQDVYHRWRTETQILATIKLEIKSDKYRTWSSKKLASAWQGQWYVEVLDQQQNVIYRKAFNYGNE